MNKWFAYCSIAFFISSLTLPSASLAAEVDSFTYRNIPIRDATPALDRYIEDKISAAVGRLNNSGISCPDIDKSKTWQKLDPAARDSVKKIYQKFKKEVIGMDMTFGYWSNIERWAQTPANCDVQNTEMNQSIYKDFGIFNGIPMMSFRWIAGIVLVNQTRIGTDKLGHFIHEGYEYLTEIMDHDASLIKLLETGQNWENSVQGFSSSGVYSHGDLGANFSGLIFWLDLFLSSNNYVECKGSKFARTSRAFSFSNYVSAAWDEGINCSKYKNGKLDQLVDARLAELGFSCPTAPEQCPLLTTMNCGKYYITPKCQGDWGSLNDYCPQEIPFDQIEKLAAPGAQSSPAPSLEPSATLATQTAR